jgi:4-amino-4-deoxy-L-arabinose transferase-like glycosyltransferase
MTSKPALLALRGLLGVVVLIVAGLYLVQVPAHPPGFSIDESSICFNAHTISLTGTDEYGVRWPLFFRAFGEYKSPTIIYLLAAVFRITGPSIAVARLLVVSCGVLAAALLGILAWQMTRRWVAAAIIAVSALLTPWLFEASRLVFEVALYPLLLSLFLLAVWRAQLKLRWSWTDIGTLTLSLALLTYSYSIGRLLAPLLALGLALFGNRERWPRIATIWVLYGLLCVPLLLFHRQNPEALTGRFKALTYLSTDSSAATNVKQFARHYLANVDPARWLLTGENNVRDHVEGTGSLLAVTVILCVIGLIIVLRYHRRNPWWRFVLYALLVSPVPASLTTNTFPQLRLVAFPVFSLLLTVPATERLLSAKAARVKGLLLAVAILLIVRQGFWVQRCYHANAPGLWYVFDARFPKKVLDAAVASGTRPIYVFDETGKSGYIQPLWYAVLRKLDPTSLVRVASREGLPPGALVISTEEACQNCQLVARALNYIVYWTPPFPDKTPVAPQPLQTFRADIVCENPRRTLLAGQETAFSFLIKNLSTAEWPCVGDVDQKHAVNLQSRWLRDDGTVFDDAQKDLPYDIEPGDTVGLTLIVTTPSQPGRYYLEVDLVQNGVARFSERGSTPHKASVDVAP